jgi:3-phosphoshikimate 1-carboxyvinyltransferase
MLSALAEGRSEIFGISQGDDVYRTREIVTQLGATISDVDGRVVVDGPLSLRASDRVLDCGNSGTTARLLTGFLGGVKGTHHLDGDNSLRRRPMDRVAQPLHVMGIDIDGQGERCLMPLTLRSVGATKTTTQTTAVASAQVKSALILAALFADAPSVISEITRTRSTTEEMLLDAGIDVRLEDWGDGRRVTVVPGRPAAHTWHVPRDPSQAAFFVVAGLVHRDARLRIPSVHNSEERIGFLSVLKRMGGSITVQPRDHLIDIDVESSSLSATTIHAHEVPSVDEVPILVVAACAADGDTRFVEMGELRLKESDRFAESVGRARSLGCEVSVDGDNFTVRGVGDASLFETVVSDHPGDHRMTMASAVAGVVGNGAVIEAPESVTSSFPDFFSLLTSVTV